MNITCFLKKSESLIRRGEGICRDPGFHVLMALCAVHCLNDLLQAVITAVYPMLKSDLGLNFEQIGLITLVYQIAASVFQPVVGLAFDRRPSAWSLPAGMCCTACGITMFAFAQSMAGVLAAVFFVGVGSSTLHPEASRITSLASHGRRGMAQSIFQVGGNLGTSVGPLLVALAVAPYGRKNILLFLIFAALAFLCIRPIYLWYGALIRSRSNARKTAAVRIPLPLSKGRTVFVVGMLMVLIFSKYIYMASLTNYYTFYLIEKFGVTVQASQICLFVFLFATAAGTLVGGPVGDRVGRKPVIWISILGCAPFSMLMPYAGSLWLTVVLSFCVGFMLSSAFPAILLYSQELLPNHLGMVSGLFFGFSFGVAGIASAVLGYFADGYGLDAIYNFCAYMPLLGVVAAFIPNLGRRRNV